MELSYNIISLINDRISYDFSDCDGNFKHFHGSAFNYVRRR